MSPVVFVSAYTCDDEYDCTSYCGNGNIVLELEGGSCEDLGIEPGDTVEYLF